MIKEIKGYDRKYFVSDVGIVYKSNMKAMHPQVNTRTGYCHLLLWKNGKPHTRYVHRLVAECFLPNPCGKREVNHKDGNKQNNSVQNLEWASRSENMSHAYRTGLRNTTPISAFSKSGDFVKTFPSVKEAMIFVGVEYNAGISRCLAGKTKTAHGYMWKYAG